MPIKILPTQKEHIDNLTICFSSVILVSSSFIKSFLEIVRIMDKCESQTPQERILLKEFIKIIKLAITQKKLMMVYNKIVTN